MTATVVLDRTVLEQRIETLSAAILAADDLLDRLDLVQARCEVRDLLVALEIRTLDHHL